MDCCIIEDTNNPRETLKLRAIFQAFSGIIIKVAHFKTASIVQICDSEIELYLTVYIIKERAGYTDEAIIVH